MIVSLAYRYGFNGAEKDDEIKGKGNHYDLGARMYDARIGRMFSLDPRAADFPYMSPYCFAANSPIYFIDYNGEGPFVRFWFFEAELRIGIANAGMTSFIQSGIAFGLLGTTFFTQSGTSANRNPTDWSQKNWQVAGDFGADIGVHFASGETFDEGLKSWNDVMAVNIGPADFTLGKNGNGLGVNVGLSMGGGIKVFSADKFTSISFDDNDFGKEYSIGPIRFTPIDAVTEFASKAIQYTEFKYFLKNTNVTRDANQKATGYAGDLHWSGYDIYGKFIEGNYNIKMNGDLGSGGDLSKGRWKSDKYIASEKEHKEKK